MKSIARRLVLRITRSASLVFAMVLAAGCTDEAGPPVPKPSTNPLFEMTIDVAVPQGLGLPENWQLILDEWSAQTGASVRLHEYDALDNEIPLNSLLTIDESRKVLPTVFVVPVTRIPELAVEGAVTPIPEDQQEPERLNWTDVFEGLRGSAARVGRNDLFVPVSSPVLVCYYRKDLLEKAGLAPPTTWTEYQTLLETIDRWAPGMTAVEPWGDEYRTTMFLARAVAFAKHPANVSFCFDINTGDPLIDHPGFVRALETARAALAKMPDEVRRYRPTDCRRDLLSGRAAIGIAFETGPDNSPLPFGPDPHDSNTAPAQSESDGAKPRQEPLDLACVRLPGSTQVFNTSLDEWETFQAKTNHSALTGFAGLAIGVSVKGNRQEKLAAWNLIGTLTMGNLESAFRPPLRSVCRVTQVPDGPRWLSDDLSPATADSYVSAVEASLSDPGLAPALPVVARSRYSGVLSEELTKYLDSSGPSPSAQETLGNVSRRWREITQEIGVARLHNSYRGALGFPVVHEDPTE